MDAGEIREWLKNREYYKVKEYLAGLNEVDLAQLLEEFPEKEQIMLFRLIRKEDAAEVFSNMEPWMQESLIRAFTITELKEVINDMYLDDTVDLLEEMPANAVDKILQAADAQTRDSINKLLKYPKDSAGSIMTIEYVDLRRKMTVFEALKKIKRIGINQETIYTCYVIENRKLIGIVTAKDLLIEDDNRLIEDIMETNVITVNTHEDKEEVAKLFHKYGFIAIPVVDTEHCLVGIVTFDDALDVWQDEVEEDISVMAAMAPSEDNYFETSVFQHARNRIFWLLFLMLSATVSGMVLTHYEQAFAAVPILVSFIPMLTGTAGNCGSQSSTLIIRGLSMDEIQFRDWYRVVFKEVRVAALVGCALALVNGARIMIMYRDMRIAVLLGISLMIIVILAKLIGCLLPMAAKKLHLDPAIMAAPLISTILDTCSILIYFSIATRMFRL
ncbi:MAG: magnesium transporter [Lachnospiraceae bacterium]|nr:magnesium transporter [Lachnospiraceae bacterium]MDY5648443.1 magnesium transporter [Lachnospiraceae bacterium]